MLTHSPTLHTAQSRGFDQTLAKATAKLSVLADTLARGHTRRPRAKVTAEITHIVKDPWVRRVVVLAADRRHPRRAPAHAPTSTIKPAPTWRPRCSANAY